VGPIIYAGEHREGRYPTLAISFAEVPLVFACMSDETTDRAPGPNRGVRIAADVGQGACLVVKWMTTVGVVEWGRVVGLLGSGDPLQLLQAVNDGVRGGDALSVAQAMTELEQLIEAAAGLGTAPAP
jgi:hypothetical protein